MDEHEKSSTQSYARSSRNITVLATLILLAASFVLTGQVAAVASTAARPNPPSGLQASGLQGGVRLTWQDNSRNETAWIITNGVTNRYLLVTNGASTGTVSFTWTGMGSHAWSCFRVRAYNAYGASAYDPPNGYVCAFSASTTPSAPYFITTSFCFGPTLNLIWEVRGSWSSFRVYKSGTLIRTLTAADENGALGVSGPEYFYAIPAPITHATLGVSVVENGVASSIAYADGTYSCPG